MSSYYREQGFHSRKRLLRRLRYLWALFLLALLVTGGLFAYDAYRQSKLADEASKASTPVTSWVVSDTQLQTSPYFQFQSSKKWRPVANESRPDHFVYRQYNSSLIEQELIIDINRGTQEVLPLVQTTRVLPVKIERGSKLVPSGSVSEHCKKGVKPEQGRNPLVISYKEVKFACNPDGTNFFVVVGVVGGTNSIGLTRTDGSKATYNITYKNLTAQPTSGDFEHMMETFEAR